MQTETVSDARQERGLAIAKAKGRQIKHVAGSKYLVPSAGSTAGYVVDAVAGECTCPDHETRGLRCKHLWAVEYFRQEVALPDGSRIVTEAVRLTYAQNWPAYNRAQTAERDRVQVLLRDLCNGIVAPPGKGRGRPRLPLSDVVYGATMKVYGLKSGRRSMSDLRACEERGFMDHAPSYNSTFRYLENPELRPILSQLVSESARPLAAIESDFAIDSTGFSTQTYSRWFDYRYGKEKSFQRFVKCHASVGVKTCVVADAQVTEGRESRRRRSGRRAPLRSIQEQLRAEGLARVGAPLASLLGESPGLPRALSQAQQRRGSVQRDQAEVRPRRAVEASRGSVQRGLAEARGS
jgi:hypothetical protein